VCKLVLDLGILNIDFLVQPLFGGQIKDLELEAFRSCIRLFTSSVDSCLKLCVIRPESPCGPSYPLEVTCFGE